ncbi:MAG TPA: type II toxin-antitoxin system prevent-host-death family antitoxin [Acidobacteriaceae bacterium]|jgi:prevent-host-death family protein|nr:type II toxin-antitoxin system prevent-host-death family antitoxin [Acidobacteriaceae bacterium]
MRSVGIAELKNKLSSYVAYAKAGETVVIRDRNMPVARLVPFVAEGASEEELELAARGIIKLPEKPMDWDAFHKLPIARLSRDAAGTDSVTRALLEEREEGW